MSQASKEDPYLDTLARMEPDISLVDRDAALASIAISLKRIADAISDDGKIERLKTAIEYAIWYGLQGKK